jgi:hypothetical protein
MSLSGELSDWIAAAIRIRNRAELNENLPVVLFCVEGVSEGAEVKAESSMYLIRPDNFNQLRKCLKRLIFPQLRSS